MQADDEVPREVLDLYERFVDRMREGDLASAEELAPGVPLTAGRPDEETGPLHPDAFTGDERGHRLFSVQRTGPERYLLRSGVAYYKVERHGERYEIVDAGFKPID